MALRIVSRPTTAAGDSGFAAEDMQRVSSSGVIMIVASSLSRRCA
jgi:hypothetical protein